MWRLLAWETGLLLTGAILTFAVMREALTHQFDDALRTKLMALASSVEMEDGHLGFDSSDQNPRQFDSANPVLFFQIWDSGGHEVTRSQSLADDLLPPPHHATPVPELWDMRLTNGLPVRVASLLFYPPPADNRTPTNSAPRAVAVLATDRRGLDSTLGTVALVLIGSSLLILVLTAVVVPWVLRRELAPVKHLAEQAQKMDAESLTERFSTQGLPGELVPITERLNDLLERLQSTFVRERQFSDDLAHEFRTPISELRSLAEVSLKWPSKRNPETDQDTLAIAIQMESMINRLLLISRSHQGSLPIEVQVVELVGMVSSLWSTIESRAVERGLSLAAELPAALEIRSDPVLVRAILSNLLENAVEYASERGLIQITASIQEMDFSVAVANPAPDLTSRDLSNLFERFWRKDPARSGNEHSGLGLSLARTLASSLGCSLNARLDGQTLTLTLSGPIDPTTSTQHNKQSSPQ